MRAGAILPPVTQRCADVIAAIHAAIEHELQRIRAAAGRPLDLLDIGCWDGETTARYRAILGGRARGVEVFAPQIAIAERRGIEVANIDLEAKPMPWPAASVDVVVANQVFEHLKNVWLPMSEIARLLAPGGLLVFSVPNLASLHNRVMLGFGWQPSSIRTFGPHVRGFTYRQARAFVEYGEYFKVRRAVGVGFYPLQTWAASWLANLWVGASHTPVLIAQRAAAAGVTPPWAAMMNAAHVGEQTFYSA